MTTPTLYNITLYVDSSFSVGFNFFSDRCKKTPMDLTGYVFEAEIRPSYGSSTLIETFNMDNDQLATGSLIMYLTSAETLPLTPGAYYWDLKVTLPDSSVERWVTGNVEIKGTITR